MSRADQDAVLDWRDTGTEREVCVYRDGRGTKHGPYGARALEGGETFACGYGDTIDAAWSDLASEMRARGAKL